MKKTEKFPVTPGSKLRGNKGTITIVGGPSSGQVLGPDEDGNFVVPEGATHAILNTGTFAQRLTKAQHQLNGLKDHVAKHGLTGRTMMLRDDQDRNALCACGSGKKFKKCCLLQNY